MKKGLYKSLTNQISRKYIYIIHGKSKAQSINL